MVKFDVEFYQEVKTVNGTITPIDHEQELTNQISQKGFSPVLSLQMLKTNGLTVDELDFIIYAMYTEQDDRIPGFRFYSDMAKLAYKRKEAFDKRFVFSSTVQHVLSSLQKNPDRRYTEHYGVAATLLLNNELFGLTRADYSAIPSSKKSKSLDYKYTFSSTGSKFIITEAKGVSDINANINKQAKDIIEKKNQSNYKSVTTTLFYGVIARIPYSDQISNGILTVVDPETPFNFSLDPLKYKVESRLNYYVSRIKRLANTSQNKKLCKLLDHSVKFIKNNWKDGYTEFERSIEIEYKIYPFNYLCTYINYENNNIMGRLYKNELSDNEYFFYGFFESLLKKLENPTIERVIEIKYKLQRNIELKEIELHYKYYDKKMKKEEFYANGFINIYETGEVIGLFKKL
ncbi:MAG: hypothetical protein EHM58_00125 [Ignavibacteriae bacterium]|nr:MAG: hypothetical protein EHM58_00125 [Ignavibacteriota bacterium]